LGYTKGLEFSDQLIEVDSADRNMFYLPRNRDERARWKQDHLFCYEICLPKDRVDEREKIMKRDLDMYFGIESELFQKQIPCVVLKKIDNTVPFKSEHKIRQIKQDHNYFYTTNQWFSVILTELENWVSQATDRILVNEAGEKISAR